MENEKIVTVKQEVKCPYCGYMCDRGGISCDHLVSISDLGYAMIWKFKEKEEDDSEL